MPFKDDHYQYFSDATDCPELSVVNHLRSCGRGKVHENKNITEIL